MSPLLLMRLEAGKRSVAEEAEVTEIGVMRNCSAPSEGRAGMSIAHSKGAQSVYLYLLGGNHSGILIPVSWRRVLEGSRERRTSVP